MGIKNPRPFTEYQDYECLWEDYIKTIVIPVIKTKKPSCVRLILCESCPAGKQNPNPNYIFANLNNQITYPTDIYLDQICKGIHQKNKLPAKKTKGDALKDLALHGDGPVIILDILPCHGVNLKTQNRKLAAKNPSNCADIKKVNDLVALLRSIVPNIQIKATFATPPTTGTKSMEKAIDPNSQFTWTLSTINSGQGRAPSRKTLSNYVNNGFKC